MEFEERNSIYGKTMEFQIFVFYNVKNKEFHLQISGYSESEHEQNIATKRYILNEFDKKEEKKER